MKLNKYQTQIEELDLESQPQEIQDQFFDCINNIPYIKTLIAEDRKRACDLPRDKEGKIIVDITKPHILEDMDYFRPSAIHFEKYKCYTKLKPNPNPNSEYSKWFKEEIRRCWEGYIRESDGEWVTGDMYFFLNYCPIQLAKKDKSGKTVRVIDFPKVWEGHYYKTHYLNQCRQQGKHAMELASRGKGKSYLGAAMLAKRFILGESKEVNEKVQCVATASEKKYIQGANQLLDMFQYYIDFCANNTQFPSRRITSSIQNLQWTMGYVDVDTNTRKGTQNSVTGITSKDDESKLRGSRGVLYLLEEAGSFPRLLNLYSVLRPSVEDGGDVWGLIFGYGCVCAGTKVLNEKGNIRNIEDIQIGESLLGYDGSKTSIEHISWKQPEAYKECLHIKTEKNNELKCSIDHPILVLNKDSSRKSDGTCSFYRANELKVGDTLLMPKQLGNFGSYSELDSYNLNYTRGVSKELYFKYRETNGKGKNFIGKSFKNLKYVTIKSIENIGIQRIYNLTADTTHTYISNGFISSNTAGDSDSDFSSMQELMYNPEGYNILGVNNVYDKEGQGRKNFTYFFPGYINRAECYDENGNSDVTKAIKEILVDRYKVKYNSTDINAITKRIAEIPITPQEAILKAKSNIFPITQLNERLNELDNNPKSFNDVYVGELVLKGGEVEFKPTTDLPIRDFPLKDNKASGAFEIFEMPQKVNNKIPQDRYIVSLDNYENDTSNTMSLGSMFVLDLFTDRIVAEYTGRPMFVDDLNEIVRKTCLFYNAKCLYENNKKNTFAYFSKMNSLYLLEDTPEYLKNKQIIKFAGYGNTSKGVSAIPAVKNHGFTLIRDWLLKPVVTTQIIDGVEQEVTVPNLSFIKNRALLKELILFNPDINVDRIMSLVQLMIFRESKMILWGGDAKSHISKPNRDYLGNDEFFSVNYDKRFLK